MSLPPARCAALPDALRGVAHARLAPRDAALPGGKCAHRTLAGSPVLDAARRNTALAVEVAECQRLVKGYSDTHARGLANYEKVMAAVARAGAARARHTA